MAGSGHCTRRFGDEVLAAALGQADTFRSEGRVGLCFIDEDWVLVELVPDAELSEWKQRKAIGPGRDSRLIGDFRQGKNRQIRRMFDHIGHPAMRIKRTAIGPLTLGDLPPGGSRKMLLKEVKALMGDKKRGKKRKRAGK